MTRGKCNSDCCNTTNFDEIENFIRFEDTGEEELTGENCPICGYPIVVEDGLELCYRCGWYRGMEEDEIWL